MKWTSTIATELKIAAAVEQAAEQVFRGLDRQEPDLLLVFVSEEHQAEFAALPGLLRSEFESACIVGCSADSVIGGGAEIEDKPALSLTAAVLPNVSLACAHLKAEQVPPVYAERRFWEDALRVTAQDEPVFLLLADPFSFETDGFLKGLDRSFPDSAKIGGLASGGRQPGSAALFLNEELHRSGTLALALTGDIEMHMALAQGSRPVGDPLFVTNGHDNLIRELDGRAPRDVLADIFAGLSPADRQLFSESLFLGVAMTSGQRTYRPGDFLVRSVLGLDPQSGALWVGGRVPVNSVVQLHIRDALSASRDVDQVLRQHRQALGSATPSGALLFSCLSRGAAFYGRPDHDSDAFRRVVADVPLSGFFCNGEIGQIRGNTHLHAHTSVFGTFGPRTRK